MYLFASNIYGRYCIPAISAHRPAARRVLAGHVYEPDTLLFLRAIPGPIIHAGTYYGDFLPALSTSRHSTIYAFEPNPLNYECARRTCEMNNLQNIQLIHAGLSDQACTLPLKIWDDDGFNLGGHSHITITANERTIPVKMIRLDDVIPEHEQIAIIQLDVEGHEQQALMGARAIIERCRPIIIVETVPDINWLREINYQVLRTIHANSVLVAGEQL